MPQAPLNPIQRFQASKYRKQLEEFLQSETGQAFLLTLAHFRPPANATLNPQIHGQQATLQDVRADSAAQIIGFDRCSNAILALCQPPAPPRPQMPPPDYQTDPLSESQPPKQG